MLVRVVLKSGQMTFKEAQGNHGITADQFLREELKPKKTRNQTQHYEAHKVIIPANTSTPRHLPESNGIRTGFILTLTT